jgi:hypothetical protein
MFWQVGITAPAALFWKLQPESNEVLSKDATVSQRLFTFQDYISAWLVLVSGGVRYAAVASSSCCPAKPRRGDLQWHLLGDGVCVTMERSIHHWMNSRFA